jgi:glycerate 2-kinase
MNKKPISGARLYRDAKSIFEAGTKSALPYAAVKKTLRKQGGKLLLGGRSYPLKGAKVYVVGAGKASALMAKAAEESLGASLTAGLVVVKYGHKVPGVRKIELAEGAHPLPDKRGAAATKRVVEMIEQAGEKDIVIGLFSGGGSALLAAPCPGVSLKEKIATTDLLLRCGAEIGELNAVRKHISMVKGGQLARIARPARMVNFLLSDVIGDKLDVIASGPAVPDSSSFRLAWQVVQKYSLENKLPGSVRSRLADGAAGKIEDTPKQGDKLFMGVRNLVIGSNSIALQAAAAKAKGLGYRLELVKRPMTGEASVYATRFLKRAMRGAKGRRPYCLLAGGETTVTVTGQGKGGRNQEFALAVLSELATLPGVVVFSAGTDGTDGPTDAAGAGAWQELLIEAQKRHLKPADYLADNDAYNFFRRAGGLYKSGPTGTNVMDLAMVLVR